MLTAWGMSLFGDLDKLSQCCSESEYLLIKEF